MSLIRKYPRSSGVLLPITALHGSFGIGVIGKEAFEFVDFLCHAGFHAWQVLPVEHTGMCNSPYKCISAFAGEPNLIDPRMLLEMGLITESELLKRMDGVSDAHVDFDLIRNKQWELLQAAFLRLNDIPCCGPAIGFDSATDSGDCDTELETLRFESCREANVTLDLHEYKNFNPFWLEEYALFISIKQQFDFQPWFRWSDSGLRRHSPDAIREFRQKHGDKLEFHRFVQWLFDKQWQNLRGYAAKRGISIIGDMPIYVSENSAEVWSHREYFGADAEGNFVAIGGVPPDYFTPDGQCWGNPIYNWELQERDNYEWWINRLRASLERYDVVRLDHFRGFASYWRIPGGEITARNGKWINGPGMKLFNALEKALGDLTLSIIAEDLGIVDEDVEELLVDSGFRGMRVLQFGFIGDEHHLPHNYPENSIAYTGTHDNTTLLAWVFELAPEDREKALFYTGFDGDWTIGGPNCPVIKSFMRTLFMTPASLAIVPIQDMLGYGADTRTNTPGVPTGNWRFRIREGVLNDIDVGFYTELHKLFQREDSVKEFKPRAKK